MDLQPSRIKSLSPGIITKFTYSGENISDRNPMVLVIWNDYAGKKIHGINFNYLSENSIKNMMKKVIKGGGASAGGVNPLIEEDQSEGTDDVKPYRNILMDPYTRLKLPTFREDRIGGNFNPISKAEAKKQQQVLYEKVFKGLVNKWDIYRSYHISKMKSIKAVRYDVEGLLK